MKWYRLAAEQGNAIAQANLGVMYEDGEGVPQDYKEAAKWYRLAAEQGEADAQLFLANLYSTGKGMPQDYKEAYIWYSLADTGDGGDKQALIKAGLEAVKEKLSPEQLIEAQSRATELFKQIEERQQ